MPSWRLLSNHALVLLHLVGHPDTTLREISRAVGLTERAVIRLVHELDAEGIVSHHRDGRRNRYRVNFQAVLTHLEELTFPFTLEQIALQTAELARRLREQGKG